MRDGMDKRRKRLVGGVAARVNVNMPRWVLEQFDAEPWAVLRSERVRQLIALAHSANLPKHINNPNAHPKMPLEVDCEGVYYGQGDARRVCFSLDKRSVEILERLRDTHRYTSDGRKPNLPTMIRFCIEHTYKPCLDRQVAR